MMNELEPRNGMSQDLGRLLLRIAIGGTLLFHGISKLIGGIGGISGMLESQGLPTFLAYGAYIGEVIAPLLIVIGLLTRMSAIVLAFNMAVAIVLAHTADIFSVNEHGGWAIELPMLYLLGALCIALLGPGRFRFGARTGWLA